MKKIADVDFEDVAPDGDAYNGAESLVQAPCSGACSSTFWGT